MEIKVMSNAKRTHKNWSGADNEILTMLLDSGKHPTVIANMIGRTESAVRTQMSKLGVYTKDAKAAPKKFNTVPKKTDNENQAGAPVNASQLGLLFSQMYDIHERSRTVVGNVNDMKSFLIDARDTASSAVEQLKQTQSMVKASLALNAITLGVVAWIILS